MNVLGSYGLIILAFLITSGAQGYIAFAYKKYSGVKVKKNLTGKEAARMLDKNGLSNVKIEEVSGYLSDHYDPQAKAVRLSTDNYNNASISAVSVACHECGHALQDKDNYHFMRFRSRLVPLVNLSTKIGYIAIMGGLLFGILNLFWLGIIFEGVMLLFQLITLPVEFNASSRALKKIEEYNILDSSELKQGKTMLTAAALTYVASVLSTVLELLRLILMAVSRDRN